MIGQPRGGSLPVIFLRSAFEKYDDLFYTRQQCGNVIGK